MKKVILVLCVLLLAGCGKKEDKPVEVPKPEDKDILVTTPESTPSLDAKEGENIYDSTKTKHVYSGNGVTDSDFTFVIEGNPCVTEDYILVRIMNISDEGKRIGMEIGRHCYAKAEDNVQGGVTDMSPDDFDEQPNFEILVGELYKLYYELPEGFVPTTYLNYVDYATKLEEIK